MLPISILAKVLGILKFCTNFAVHFGVVAQLVEQRTENPCVTGSIPVDATNRSIKLEVRSTNESTRYEIQSRFSLYSLSPIFES